MRKFTLITLLFFTACNKPSSNYKIVIHQDSLDVFSGYFIPHDKIKIQQASSDSEAYKKGLIEFYGCLQAEALFKKKGLKSFSKTKSFEVNDKEDMNVEFKLSSKAVDSMNKKIEKISQENIKKM
jgi:hypothetical protein